MPRVQISGPSLPHSPGVCPGPHMTRFQRSPEGARALSGRDRTAGDPQKNASQTAVAARAQRPQGAARLTATAAGGDFGSPSIASYSSTPPPECKPWCKNTKTTLVCAHPNGGGWEVSAGPGEGSGPGARPSSPEEAGGLRVNPFVPGGPSDPASPRSVPVPPTPLPDPAPLAKAQRVHPSCRAL